jgi:phosphoglycolate phosphatase-like HAD superfamily hydrolase
LIKELDVSPLDVLFIGNSSNDELAGQSGARTLCVNPHFTDPATNIQWSYAIRKMENLGEILPFV